MDEDVEASLFLGQFIFLFLYLRVAGKGSVRN
jgi:hypothetical protein